MTENLPSVTVIIAARPEQTDIKSVTAAKSFDYPAEKLEILVARGKQPSVQRNAAMRAARGDLIYFLDDDSVAEPGNLRTAVARFQDPKVNMLGGPNLCPNDAPVLEQVFATVLASWLAFGPSRARYARVGALRGTSEKELILCNLIARRAPMIELGGFDEKLYPNEENALMDELQKSGGKLLYDPQFSVHRRPRPSFPAFVKMLKTYGRGRAEQFRVNPTPGSALNLIPPLFCVYLVTAAVALLAAPHYAKFVLIPLALYAFAVLAQVAASALTGNVLYALASLPLIILTHVLYGYGFWRGLFTRLDPPEAKPAMPVVVEKVK